MKYLKFVIAAALVCFLAVYAIKAVQTTEAVIKVVPVSHQTLADGEIDTTKYHSPSTGLKVVGLGELVYLKGMDAEGQAVTTYTWTLTGPAGSAATLDATDAEMVTFRPDIAGQYQVGLTITTASGNADTSVTITSAEYVGVGTVGGLTPSFAKGQCAICHSDKEVEWKETGHATMFELAIDGLKSSHYGESCIECHTVGFNEDTEAVNGGFDDVAQGLGWTFPDT
ncbi:MAG: multiheme c-type cytochrome, partial [bacterium]